MVDFTCKEEHGMKLHRKTTPSMCPQIVRGGGGWYLSVSLPKFTVVLYQYHPQVRNSSLKSTILFLVF